MTSATDPRPVVLVVDDKPNMLRLMSKVLQADMRVLTAERGTDAARILEAEPVDVILSDLRMPDMDGLQLLQASKRLRPRSEFILMTAFASVATAVEALKLGARDYLTKPFEPQAAHAVVLKALGRHAAPSTQDAPPVSSSDEVLPGMLAVSAAMRELGALARRVAASDATVVLMGETGTGKELLARAIHRLSPRAIRRFLSVNCAAIPAELLESEFFGHAKGAFTGATRDRSGLLEEAQSGTLLLDEVGELPRPLQAKLTRALEQRTICRLGEALERPVDVRLIAATHRDLEAMVKEETFRRDLWYRLNVAVIRIPPLRERAEDVELLAQHFLKERLAANPSARARAFSASALALMKCYAWPGNVRQLRAAVERASVVAVHAEIDVGDLPPEVGREPSSDSVDLASLTWNQALERGREEVARRYLEEVLSRHEGRVADAAAHAQVERESFYRLMRRFNIDPDSYRGRRGPGGGIRG